MCTLPRQRGISLIELIMFIMIVSVALAGILLVMNTTTMGSANPLIQKQSLAIAESLLEEVELMPFTFCDPDDDNAGTAQVAAVDPVNGCATWVEGLPDNDVSRYDAALPYDNVSDYAGFTMAAGGILDVTGTPIGPAAGYSATIAVTPAALDAVPAAESLRITVTVTGPDGVSVAVDGYRTRYSPRI